MTIRMKEDQLERHNRLFKLIGESTSDSLIAKTYFYLAHELDQEKAFLLIAEQCQGSNDYEAIAQAIKLMIIFDPENTHLTLKWLFNPVMAGNYLLPEGITDQYVLGAILGFFNAGIYLKNEWKDKTTDFFKNLPSLIAKIILNEMTFKKIKIDEKYEGQLSPVIKEFISGRHIPKKFVIKLMEEINSNLQINFSPLGEMLLRQICIKYFLKTETWNMAVILHRGLQNKV